MKKDAHITPVRIRAMRRYGSLLLFLLTAVLAWAAIQGVRPLVVYSGSMAPSIPTGSIVFVSPEKPDALKVGDIITVKLAGAEYLVTHRVQAKQLVDGEWVFQTKGDANSYPDPHQFIIKSTAGKTVFHVRWLGYAVVYASSPLIRAAIVGVVVYLILGWPRKRSTSTTLVLGPGNDAIAASIGSEQDEILPGLETSRSVLRHQGPLVSMLSSPNNQGTTKD